MADFLERAEILIGRAAIERLQTCHVYVAGIGGVGSYTAEALARAGISRLTIHDADTVTVSNINRQLVALHSTVGRFKTDVMKERILDINPDCRVTTRTGFMRVEHMGTLLQEPYDAVVDAIDVLNCKLSFLIQAYRQGYRLYSSMGAGNSIDPTKITSGDLFESRNCRLAKVVRKKLRQAGISSGIKAVWSRELRSAPQPPGDASGEGRITQGSISTIPALFGILLAGLLVKDIIDEAADSQ